MIDIKADTDNITISYNYMHDHHKLMLGGSSDSDNYNRRVTLHHNWIDTVGSRTPMDRFGTYHIFNNYYNNVTVSGINVRMGGIALIEANYFENSANPVTSRDSDTIGYWDLRNNYVGTGITWDSTGVNATNWTTSKTFSATLGYTYTLDSPALVKCIAKATAGAGKSLATTSSGCGSSSSSSSSAASSASSSSSSSSSSTSSSSSSAASSSASSAPTLSGTGDYPDGFTKCAALGETCSVKSGTGWVAFGCKGSWVAKYVGVGNSIACTVAAFGSDPVGNPNKCSYQK
jgi:pectate lyase